MSTPIRSNERLVILSGNNAQSEDNNSRQRHGADAPDRGESPPVPMYGMLLLALLVGVIGGFGAIVFSAVIALFRNVFFYGDLSLSFDPDMHIEPSTWGVLVILVPVIGAVLVTWITRTFAPEARGHGVPEVMGAIYHRQGTISPVIVLAKAVASAISLGTGGSVGREGPIIQIGSAFGSTLGQIIHMPARQRITLISAGAAAGIAATFNAPIGGLVFAIELLLVSINPQTVVLVAMSTVTATYVGRLYTGLAPSFDVPAIAGFSDHLVSLYVLLLCVPFGLLIGLASVLFIRTLYWAEDAFDRFIANEYLRHMIGMLAVGVLMYLMLRLLGQYYVAGVSYSVVIDVLEGALSNPVLLLGLFLAKLLATTLTLGSGGSGGVFSPSLFFGATLGGGFGGFFAWLFPDIGIDPIVFAVAGMAGMVGGTTGAVVTAIVMLVEQTRDYNAILPIVTTVGLASAVRVWFTPESIYTLKLARRGDSVPQGLETPMVGSKQAGEVMTENFQVMDFAEMHERLARQGVDDRPEYTIITDGERVIGVVNARVLDRSVHVDPEVAIDRKVAFVTTSTPWPVLMRELKDEDSDVAVVVAGRSAHQGETVVGVIGVHEMARAARKNAHLVDH